MSRDTTLDELKSLFEEMFDVDPDDVVESAQLYDDLDIDSIDAVDLIVKIREMTGKKIAPEEFKNVRTVAEVVDAIEALRS